MTLVTLEQSFIPLALSLATSLFCAVVFRLIYRHLLFQSNVAYPPGPPSPSLLLGHYGKLPTRKPYIKYQEMSKTYGDVIYFRNLRDHLVVLNSAQAANDLLEKQARVSSDRPFGNMMDKFAGWGTNIALRPYDETWRQSRRAFHQNFRSEAMVKYEPVQMEKVHEFIRALSLSPNPEQLWSDISTFSQGIMFSSIYGLNIVSKEILPKAARLAADQIDWNLLPGNVSFKRLPFIHLVLSLMPNCQLSRHQKKIRETIDQLRERPFKAAMEAWNSDSHPSMVGELMSKHIADGKSAQEVESIKDMGASALVASADTTMTATASFFFAMSLYPDVQAKAREELDRVLGPGKIPRLSDRGSLPYIEAVYRELMRWHPTVPMGVPHQSTEDIIYKGYLIPKGATLSANIWAMTHDPEQFPDPYRFIPERHLRDDGKFDNINSITAYGFGRRVCVGRYVADTTLWLVIACVLATTDIYRDDGLDKSEALKGMDVEEYFTDGGLCHLRDTVPGCKVQSRFSTNELETVLESDRAQAN